MRLAVIALIVTIFSACGSNGGGGGAAASRDGGGGAGGRWSAEGGGAAGTGASGASGSGGVAGSAGVPSDAGSGDAGATADGGPLCEAKGTGVCYYLDAVRGNDSNPGTFDAPWLTTANILSYYKSAYRPAGWVQLRPGDVVYLMSGQYTTVVPSGSSTGPTGGIHSIAYFRGIDGTAAAPIVFKAYPGQKPSIGSSSQKTAGTGMILEGGSYWVISGLEIQNMTYDGLDLEGPHNVQVRDMIIHHNASGVTGGNPDGVKVRGAGAIEISNSTFYENVENPVVILMRGNGIQLFDNDGDVTVRGCHFYQTTRHDIVDSSGTVTGQSFGNCLMYKHAATTPSAAFDVFDNSFDQCNVIGSGTQNTHFHHNIVANSTNTFRSDDFGGTTHQVNQIIEYNTFYDTGALKIDPATRWANAQFPEFQNVVYRYNVHYTGSVNMIRIDDYMSDATLTAFAAQFFPDHNCYFVSSGAAPTFSMGKANGGNYGSLGGTYNLSQWRQTYGFDQHSVVADPLFVDAANKNLALSAASPCAGWGAYTGGHSPSFQ